MANETPNEEQNDTQNANESIPVVLAGGGLRLEEIYDFVSEINLIMTTNGWGVESAIAEMENRARRRGGEMAVKALHSKLKVLSGMGLYSERTGEICSNSEFINQVQKLKKDLFKSQQEKEEKFSAQASSYREAKYNYTKARRKRNLGIVRKWGAFAIGVAVAVGACFALPALAGVVAGAIGGAASIAAAVGVAIVAGAALYGIYRAVKAFVVYNFDKGNEMIDKGKEDMAKYKQPYEDEKAKYNEAQAKMQNAQQLYSEVSALDRILDATEEVKNQALNIEETKIALSNPEKDGEKYERLVDNYKELINEAKTCKDVENAKKWLADATNGIMSQEEYLLLCDLQIARLDLDINAKRNYYAAEAGNVLEENAAEEKIINELLTDGKFSRETMQTLKGHDCIKLEGENRKKAIENAVTNSSYATREKIAEQISKSVADGNFINEATTKRVQDAILESLDKEANRKEIISAENLKSVIDTQVNKQKLDYWTQQGLASRLMENDPSVLKIASRMALEKALKDGTYKDFIDSIDPDKQKQIMPYISVENADSVAFQTEAELRAMYPTQDIKGKKAIRSRNKDTVKQLECEMAIAEAVEAAFNVDAAKDKGEADRLLAQQQLDAKMKKAKEVLDESKDKRWRSSEDKKSVYWTKSEENFVNQLKTDACKPFANLYNKDGSVKNELSSAERYRANKIKAYAMENGGVVSELPAPAIDVMSFVPLNNGHDKKPDAKKRVPKMPKKEKPVSNDQKAETLYDEHGAPAATIDKDGKIDRKNGVDEKAALSIRTRVSVKDKKGGTRDFEKLSDEVKTTAQPLYNSKKESVGYKVGDDLYLADGVNAKNAIYVYDTVVAGKKPIVEKPIVQEPVIEKLEDAEEGKILLEEEARLKEAQAKAISEQEKQRIAKELETLEILKQEEQQSERQ